METEPPANTDFGLYMMVALIFVGALLCGLITGYMAALWKAKISKVGGEIVPRKVTATAQTAPLPNDELPTGPPPMTTAALRKRVPK